MNYLKGIPFTLMAVILVTGLSACSQDRQPNTDSEEISAIMFKNPDCKCCDKWAVYLEQHGFSVSVETPDNMQAVKMANNIPYTMGSCHTALIGDYVVEGHVPQEAIRKLLDEQPDAAGIAVPGMPIGSPGMETPGQPAESYNVYLFGGQGNPTVFTKH